MQKIFENIETIHKDENINTLKLKARYVCVIMFCINFLKKK